MKIIDRKTNEVIICKTRRSTHKVVLAPIYYKFMNNSHTLLQVVEKYKNEPLLPYVMTNKMKKRVAENPALLENLPRMIVNGYDKEVTAAGFDRKITQEFWDRWDAQDHELFELINKHHPYILIVDFD